MMIWRKLPRSIGTNKDKLERTSLMIVNTGHMVVTVSCLVIVQCQKWAKENQLMLLTTNAKHTKIVKNVSVKSMVTAVLVSLSDTHGNMLQSNKPLFHQMMLVPVNVNCLNVIFNLSKILLLKKMSLTRTTMVSGLQLVSIMKMIHHAHQVVTLQLIINAVVVLMLHGIGLVLTTTNAVINLKTHLVPLSASMINAKL